MIINKVLSFLYCTYKNVQFSTFDYYSPSHVDFTWNPKHEMQDNHNCTKTGKKIWCICKLCFIRGNYLEIIKQFFLVKFHAIFFPNFLSYYLCELKNVYDSTSSVSTIQSMFTLKNMLYLYE